MKTIIEKLKSVSGMQWLAVGLIIIGLAIMIPKAMGMRDFYNEVQFARVHNFAAGNPSPDLLRPWMSIRYISVAYAVPQKYLFEATNIQPGRETSMIAVNRLNRQLGLGDADGAPALMKTLRAAIAAYHNHPVVTGLIEKHVEGWMSVEYIANSTGIPAETIFTATAIPMDGNAYKPLDFLSGEIKYNGGPKALVAAIQKVVDSQGAKP